MSRQERPKLIDERLLKAQSQPIRAHILNILSEGPSSPARMQRRMGDIHLNLVSYHVKELLKVGLIELVEIRKHGGREEHIYRAMQRQFFDADEWAAVDPGLQQPIVTTIIKQISEDVGRAMGEGRFAEFPDRHVSRSPIELDRDGWSEVVDILAGALDGVLEAHARSAERAQKSGEDLMVARVMMLQFPLGREDPAERKDASAS